MYALTVPLILSFFLGICTYTETMVADMRETLGRLDNSDGKNMWLTCVNEIGFHCEIIK